MLTKKFEFLQVLRAVAALLVVLFHTQSVIGRIVGRFPFDGMFDKGDKGVDLFFVLSGFVMAFVHYGDIGRPERFRNYIYRRVCRIYPSVWIVTFAAMMIYAAGLEASKLDKLEPGNIVASLLLLPYASEPIVNVTWTLKYEMFFYAVFGVMIVWPRLGGALLLTWQGLALAGIAAGGFTNPLLAFCLHPIVLEFGIGASVAAMVIYCLSANVTFRPWQACLILATGVAGFVATALLEPYAMTGLPLFPRSATYGVSAGLIVLGCCLLEHATRRHVWRFALFLGDASYAIYLVHFSTVTVTVTLLAEIGAPPITDMAAAGVASLGIGAGIAFYILVDKPISRWLSTMQRRQARPASSPA